MVPFVTELRRSRKSDGFKSLNYNCEKFQFLSLSYQFFDSFLNELNERTFSKFFAGGEVLLGSDASPIKRCITDQIANAAYKFEPSSKMFDSIFF